MSEVVHLEGLLIAVLSDGVRQGKHARIQNQHVQRTENEGNKSSRCDFQWFFFELNRDALQWITFL